MGFGCAGSSRELKTYHEAIADVRQRWPSGGENSLLKNLRFVSGHRFSDAIRPVN
jgi:hypothetical protein